MTSNVPDERLVELRAEERARVVAARPEGTTRAYGDADCTKGCTREWAEWCAAAPGSSLHGVAMDLEKPIYSVLVTPDKVEEFLGKYYTVRPRLNAQRETQGDGTSLGTKMINKVINALNDLYRAQRADPSTTDAMKDVQKPRSSEYITMIVQRHATQSAERNKAMYLDRGKGRTVLEGYTPDQHTQLSRFGIYDKAPHPRRSPMYIGARFHLSHVARHALAFRGDSLRKVQLPDICILDAADDEGSQACKLLVIVHDNGKNNAEGRVDTSAAMRHADDPSKCLHFALALWFFVLYVVEKRDLPDFLPRPDTEKGIVVRPWYDDYLLPGNSKGSCGKAGPANPKVQIKPRQMEDETKYALAQIKPPVTDTNHIVHLCRGVSLRMAQAAGVSAHECGRAANHVGYTALDRSYLTGLPYQFIRFTAGFGTSKGHYFLLRNMIVPPRRLTDEVFRSILDPLNGHIGTEAFPRDLVDGATTGFIELMTHLSGVLVQDAAVLYDDMQKHALFSRAPFCDDSFGFHTFRRELQERIQHAPADSLRLTEEAARLRGDELTATAVRDVSTAVLAHLGAAPLDTSRDAVGRSVMRLAETPQKMLAEIHAAVAVRDAHAPRALSFGDPAPAPLLENAAVAADAADPTTWPTTGDLPPFVRVFRLPTLKTVSQVADAYFRGPPAIRDLDRLYGHDVRTGAKGKGHSWYSGVTRDDERKFEKHLYKFRAIMTCLEEHGESKVDDLQDRITAEFPGDDPKTSQLTWLAKELRQEAAPDAFEANRKRAIAGAEERRAKKRASAGETPRVEELD